MLTGHPTEPLLKVLIGHFDGMVYRCRDDEFWTMEFVSEGCATLTGYQPHELLFNSRVSYEEITLPKDRERVRQAIHAALGRHERFDLEYRIQHASGEIRWVQERGYGVFDADGRLEAIDGFVQDITQRKQSERALIEAERRFRDIFENAQEGIFQTTPDGHYLQVNPALARIYGYPSQTELIKDLQDITRQLYVDPERRREFVHRMETDGQVSNFESQVYRHDGRIIWISENARAVRNADSQVRYYEGTVEDITDRKAYEERIEQQATHDALTGLPNRMLLRDRLQQAIHHSQRSGQKLALIFIDIDHFKDVNDTLGHLAGDHLIQRVAQRLVGCVRSSDTVARQGGDEFVLLLETDTDSDALARTTQRVLESVAQPCAIEGRELTVTCSLGISLYPEDGTDADTLLKHADTAMYEAKHAGRNTFRMFTPGLTAAVAERLEMASRLRQALQRNEFELHYQPKVDLQSGRPVGAEALLRWRPGGGELVPPAHFIRVAEESGMIEPIGDWVLNEACQRACAWQAVHGLTLPVSVNVSPRQFRRIDLVASVERALADSGLKPGLLELEITESCLADDTGQFVRILHELDRLGVILSIDDFGAGYSSMAYLKQIPINRLKIDQSFVHGLEEDRANRAILRAIVALGRNLGHKVLAEGVETLAEYEFLLDIGCDEAQGYYFGRPAPADAFAATLVTTGRPSPDPGK